MLAREFLPGGIRQRHILHGKLGSGDLIADRSPSLCLHRQGHRLSNTSYPLPSAVFSFAAPMSRGETRTGHPIVRDPFPHRRPRSVYRETVASSRLSEKGRFLAKELGSAGGTWNPIVCTAVSALRRDRRDRFGDTAIPVQNGALENGLRTNGRGASTRPPAAHTRSSLSAGESWRQLPIERAFPRVSGPWQSNALVSSIGTLVARALLERSPARGAGRSSRLPGSGWIILALIGRKRHACSRHLLRGVSSGSLSRHGIQHPQTLEVGPAFADSLSSHVSPAAPMQVRSPHCARSGSLVLVARPVEWWLAGFAAPFAVIPSRWSRMPSPRTVNARLREPGLDESVAPEGIEGQPLFSEAASLGEQICRFEILGQNGRKLTTGPLSSGLARSAQGPRAAFSEPPAFPSHLSVSKVRSIQTYTEGGGTHRSSPVCGSSAPMTVKNGEVLFPRASQ